LITWLMKSSFKSVSLWKMPCAVLGKGVQQEDIIKEIKKHSF